MGRIPAAAPEPIEPAVVKTAGNRMNRGPFPRAGVRTDGYLVADAGDEGKPAFGGTLPIGCVKPDGTVVEAPEPAPDPLKPPPPRAELDV